MARTRAKQLRSEDRCRDILRAALACFSEIGFDRTTIDDIRTRSGASTGSIYHHFGSKEQLAAALYLQGIVEYQEGFIAALREHPQPREGIVAIVRYHLGWVERNPDWARYLFTMRRAEFMDAAEEAIQNRNREYFRQIGDWFRPHVRAGRLRRLPHDVYSSVLLGPCMDFSKRWLSGRTQTDLKQAAESIAETTWQSLRGQIADD